MSKGKLYLIPTPIGDQSEISVFIKNKVVGIRNFIAENEKDSRRFLSKCGFDLKSNYPDFYILNEHTPEKEYIQFLQPLMKGMDMALMSDAGMPCIADPGFQIVSLCHEKQIEVVPVSGSSSILLALMASGFNGQKFIFHGYIPIEKKERHQFLRQMESEAHKKNITQIFIETPYRNNGILSDMILALQPSTKLCIGLGIESAEEKIKTKTMEEWKKQEVVLEKAPAVFLIGL